MIDAGRPFAPLTSAMIRRATPVEEVASPAEPDIVADETPRWQEDLRLFALTWLAGFVFFLVFLG